MLRIAVIKGLVLGLAFAAPVAGWGSMAAQTPPDATSQWEADAAFAQSIERLTREQNLEGALKLLDSRPDLAGRADAVRLRAALLHQLGRSGEALALLEAHLTRESSDALARFQLAEIHFGGRRDQAARLAYRLALAGQLDPLRRQVAEARLGEIQMRRDWRFWAGGAVAPDSNINSATDAQRVDLFGLPFELDDAARRQSGVSLSAFGGVERSFRYADGQSIRLSLVGSASDAPGAQFDTASISLRGGPEWTFGRDAELSLQATASKRWFGGEVLETRGGLFLGGEFGQRTRWSGAGYVDAVDDKLNDGRDGWSAGVDAARTRYLSPSSLWRLGLSVTHRETEAAAESYTQVRISTGLLLPMPFATMVYVEPYATNRRYQAPAVAFGVLREDVEAGIAARLSKRDWSILGAYPYVSGSISHSESTIGIGDFSRERMEFGLTREF